MEHFGAFITYCNISIFVCSSVCEWEDPFDTTLYCLQSDRDNTIVTGSSRYGMLRLWDKRKIQPVQVCRQLMALFTFI